MKLNKLNIKDELVADIRMFKAPILAQTIFKNNQEKELFNLALEKDHLLSSRAMWVLSHCSDMDYDRIKPYHVKLVSNLKNKNLHNGVIRNTLRLFQKHAVPKKHEIFMLDKCYEYIKNPTEAIAVRAFAMTVVFNISKPYNDLLKELSIVLIHLNITEESAGIKSRVKHTLKAINQQLVK